MDLSLSSENDGSENDRVRSRIYVERLRRTGGVARFGEPLSRFWPNRAKLYTG